MKVLVIDVGGTHVKVASTDTRVPIKIPSGTTLTAESMCTQVLEATKDWKYDCISIGYPGPVIDHKPIAEPHNLGPGWVGFDYAAHLGKPVRILNDAAMQALGGYRSGRMLFLGTGTGLGSAIVLETGVIALELAHLPYKKKRTYEDYLGVRGLQHRGKKKWRRSVRKVIGLLQAAMVCDNVLLGGGNAKVMKKLPQGTRIGANSNAIQGGFRLWNDPQPSHPVKVARKGKA